jgi:hypothetical protein
VADARDFRGVQPSSDVREDWLTCLPEEQDRFFETVRSQLESAYQITSIALNDVLTLCTENRLPPPAEQSAIIVTLFDRLARLLQAVLRSMGEHGRRFGTVSAVVPLRPGFFRSPNAQRIARNNQMVYRVLFSAKARFFRKLRALLQIVATLQNETRYISRIDTNKIAQSWGRLEEFHYDLNTCLRETMVAFKSFLWVVPVEQLAQFQIRLKSRIPPQEQFFLDDMPISGNNS